jgi:hypothetical protein
VLEVGEERKIERMGGRWRGLAGRRLPTRGARCWGREEEREWEEEGLKKGKCNVMWIHSAVT